MMSEQQTLQFYLKHFQEEGLLSIDSSFDCLSIDGSVFRKFINNPFSIYQISSGIDTRTFPLTSIKCSLKDVSSDNKLESKVPNSSNLNSDHPSLESTHEKSNSFLDSIHRDSSSYSDDHSISSFTSSSFNQKILLHFHRLC